MIGYQIREASNGQHYVALLSPGNHEVLMTSETYTTKQSAEGLVELLQENGLHLVAQLSNPTPSGEPADHRQVGELDL